MKTKVITILTVAMSALSGLCQTPKSGFGDKGCPEQSLFVANASISGNDFMEVHQMRSYTRNPHYTVRIYGDGRLVWHGEDAVKVVGDASENVSGAQAEALIANARKLGFGSLCDAYAMRAFDGSRSVTTLRIGGQTKVVTNSGPSNAPSWLYKLQQQVAAFEAVQRLIGEKTGSS